MTIPRPFSRPVPACAGSVFLLAGLLAGLPAQAAGLDQAKTILDEFNSELTTIIPILATIILVLAGVAYAGRFMDKEMFVRWAVGTIVAGSAAQIAAMFFTTA